MGKKHTKVFNKLLVLVLSMAMVVTPMLNVTLVQAATENLALGGTATASHEDDDPVRGADLAIDGLLATRWSTDHNGNPQDAWIKIDLGRKCNIENVVLNWEGACGEEYKIQTSDNGFTWTDVAHITNGAPGTITIPVEQSARFVRMLGIKTAGYYGYSLYEFEVHGTEAIGVSENLSLYKPAESSSISGEQGEQSADKAFDGDIESRWGSNSNDTEWIDVDLEGTYPIDTIILHWEASYAAGYKIQVSDDKNAWEDVYVETNGQGGTEIIPLTDVEGRFVRMQATQKSGIWGVSLYEMEVYGIRNEEPEPPQPVEEGWVADGDKWQYRLDDGNFATGWKIAGSKWYFLSEDTYMKTGWLEDDGIWYFLDRGYGEMKVGWAQDGNVWYYLDKNNGHMQTGWTYDGYEWYYLGDDGDMKVSQWIGDYYVLDDGSMATDQWVGDYYVGADGKWDPSKTR